jgi:hypothetical protein
VTGIDWNTQLKKIERQFDGIPTPPTPAELRMQREQERREQQRRKKREETWGAATRVVLVLSLGLLINAWPYDRACGAGLAGYMTASGLIVAGGIWAAAATWHHRTPKLHATALFAIAWGITLVSAQVLPRVGYATVDRRNVPAWRCWRPGQPSVGVPAVKQWLRRGVR